MEFLVFKMDIIDVEDNNYTIKISNETEHTRLTFDPDHKSLHFITENHLTDYFKENEYQLRKMLHNKRKDTYYVGFHVTFVLIQGKDVAAFNDRSNIVVLDKRDDRYETYVIDEAHARETIYKIYTDASYLEYKQSGGLAFIIEDLEGNYKLYTDKVEGIGSSQAELMAVIKALDLLQDVEEIRIITDSQYVRKGLAEWIPLWRLNGFHTINGEKAKNIDDWLRADEACNNKYIEFQWVKGHSDHFENSLCDMYARDMAHENV